MRNRRSVGPPFERSALFHTLDAHDQMIDTGFDEPLDPCDVLLDGSRRD